MATSMQDLFDRLDAVEGEGSGPRKVALITEALTAIEDEHGRDSLAYASALNELGACYRADADYGRAATYFKQAVDLLEQVAGPASPDFAMALMNYAGVLRLNGALDESLALFERAETLFAETLGTDSMEYLTALNNAALCHQDRGAFETALARHLRVCSALERLDDATVAYATSLYNTGFCCKQLGETDLGEDLIRRSIEVYRQLLPEYHELIEHAKAAVGEGGLPAS
ncbi:tetratricopeptide repeat protein [Eggerthella sinensis]|uniref:tetratricopeptide repeat protein n=1 Tax=Eggerthella sinensis TaxID=242230 RepID=UPI00266CD760|nr:tetratricopeptide repeat protein [Eggerthella sinensis]